MLLMRNFGKKLVALSFVFATAACGGSENLNGTDNPVIVREGVSMQVNNCTDGYVDVSFKNPNNLSTSVTIYVNAGDDIYGFTESIEPGESEITLRAADAPQYLYYPSGFAPLIKCNQTDTLD